MDDGRGEFGEARSGGQALSQYLHTVRKRWWFVLLAVVLCTLGATAYVLTAPKVYQAQANMLITPVPAAQTTVLGLGLLRQVSDPTGDVATASLQINNANVAAQVRANLRLRDSPQALLQQISVQPVATSSIVSITAATESPHRSQQLANGFATAAVQVQTAQLYKALDPAITNLQARINAITAGRSPARTNNATQPLYQQLAALEALRSAPDPTLQVETAATLPTSPSSPQKKTAIAAGLIGGLLIGIAGAFVLEVFDPRSARERGIEKTGLPILTRVPLLGRSGRTRHAFDESFRSLRTMLRFSSDKPIGTIAVTSASEKEGKTTTSFQLAMAMLEAGQRVLLVEADPFRPGLRSLVEFDADTPRPGLLEYLSGAADLDEVIERTTLPGLMFVPAGSRQPTSITALLEGQRGRSFVHDVLGLADVVILDCPPVGPRSDAVLIASYADAVLIVVDLQRSDERDFLDTVRRLRRTDARLLGIVLNRETSASATYDYREQGEKSPRYRTMSTQR